MITVIKKILSFTLILFCTHSYGLNNPTISERIWIKQNLLKPEANLIFIISVNESMLISHQEMKSHKKDSVNYQSMSRDELKQLISENPSEQNNPYALLALANSEILSADFSHARININKAYTISPKTTDIFLSELLYQLYEGLILLSQNIDDSDKLTLMISTDFLAQAEKEHTDYEVPKIIHNGLNVLKVFYSVIVRNIERFKQRTAFEFFLDKDLHQLVNTSKTYFQSLLNNDNFNPYFSKLCLMMLAVIENDIKSINFYFNALRMLPEVDNNLYRLMTISDISQAHFAKAIVHMKASIEVKDTIDDRLMLASLYSLKSEQNKALKVLKNSGAKATPELLIHQLGYTLLSGDFISANHLYQDYRQNPVLMQSSQLLYYALIIELLNEDYGQAGRYLQALSNSEELFNNAQIFIDHFNRSEMN